MWPRTSSTTSASSSAARSCRAGPRTTPPPVLLIDEVDRADDEFEAFLLEFLSEYTVSVPELGTVRAATPPIVVLTSNRTRDVHDALKRRCMYHWVEHPDFEREVAIVRLRAPQVVDRLARQVAAAVEAMRGHGAVQAARGGGDDRLGHRRRRPRGAPSSTRPRSASTLGTVLKYREDAERVLAAGHAGLVQAGLARGGVTPLDDPARLASRSRTCCGGGA